MSPRAAGRALWRVKSEPQAEICAGRIWFARAFEICRGPCGMEHPAGRCGITFEKFQDIKEGDTVEAYVMEQIEV